METLTKAQLLLTAVIIGLLVAVLYTLNLVNDNLDLSLTELKEANVNLTAIYMTN
jgi:hypothetical protein